MSSDRVANWWRESGWPWLRDQPIRLTAFCAFLLMLLLWETAAAPPWQVGARNEPESLIFLADDGSVIARRGEKPVEEIDAAILPDHVKQAFIAIEDRRFEGHHGIDMLGLARATFANVRAMGVVEGGSTITQQYVKNAYLTQDQTIARKAKEFFLADWIENWMSKDEILSRYLETAYFGDGQTGLTAAARHYFNRRPEKLKLEQAAMLAGMIKAPSKLAPTVNREAAIERMNVVLAAMVDAGFITQEEADATPDPVVDTPAEPEDVPAGNWFTDWISRDLAENATGEIKTTLDRELQALAERAVSQARLGGAEAALIAIRPDGRVVAMVGGTKWQPEAFNRALFAERQPGSTFKLFDYLAALRDGATPDDTMLDAPLDIDGWKPTNGYDGYKGVMTIREAFAISSNTVAVRAAQTAGYDKVREAARDLGVHSDLPEANSLPLGTANMTLAELVAAYAAFDGGRYPVKLYGREEDFEAPETELDPQGEWIPMLDLLWNAANIGTGRAASLSVPTFGKTGTSQDGRDSLFVGFAGNLVTAVWVGRDDNQPIAGNSGGRLPAQIWNYFMSRAELGSNSLPFIASGSPGIASRDSAEGANPAQATPVRLHRGSSRKKGRGKHGRKKR